jgi:hypothetical protein
MLNVYYSPRLGSFQPRIGGGLGVEAVADDADYEERGAAAQVSAGGFFWFGDHFAIGPTARFRAGVLADDAETRQGMLEFGAKVSF